MTREKPLTRWECTDCSTVGYTTESRENAFHPRYMHYSEGNTRCAAAGLRGLLADAEREDKDIVFITSLRSRLKALGEKP